MVYMYIGRALKLKELLAVECSPGLSGVCNNDNGVRNEKRLSGFFINSFNL